MPKRWTFYPPSDDVEALARQINTGPLLTQVLINRGLTTPEACRGFLNCGYETLHRPELMPGLSRAAERIVKAIRGGEKVAIYGDYDVDGLTASATLYQCLELAGAPPTVYVPHRIEEGYGLNCDAIRQLADQGHTLIVTVDCGVTSPEEAALARELGVDLIITDHHEPEPVLPDAYVVVDPKLPDSAYPFRDLAGVGIAFKLAWAVGLHLAGRETCTPEFQRFLTDATSLAALGTIADVVPLVGENRALAGMGLKSLSNKRYHVGLEAIVESARLRDDRVREHDVAFIIGPRLNAAGRMGSAEKALRLLTSATADEAAEIAADLERENRRRQEVEREIFAQAAGMINEQGGLGDRRTIVLASPQWHAGVIGIVASRLVEQYHRPTILIALEDGQGQGSGRSIPGFSLFEALDACSEALLRFGGHAMAAGLRLEAGNVGRLTELMEAYGRKTIKPADLIPSLTIDSEAVLGAVTVEAIQELQRLAPFGQGNARPTFAVRGCTLATPPKRMGKSGAHMSLQLTQAGVSRRAVWWRAGDQATTLARAASLDVAFRPRINRFGYKESVELDVLDIHPGGYRDPDITTDV
ncbi:MAG: single-stranded-DNA-specific exonuclease RecJ [Planctomycetes bacterium]|nr:single-stranded-DNA-specific exonuclease RecJ [Planctomycetota bacterium]